MTTNWEPLTREFALWRAEGLTLAVWWRDDDAIDTTPQLEQLIALSRKMMAPLHLAVIPQPATQNLADRIRNETLIRPVVHGWRHQNHAPTDEKKAEFGATRPKAQCRADFELGLARMRDLFKDQFHMMFVPPWNRFNPALADDLTELGYQRLSTYLPRKHRFASQGLEQVNTHFDPVNWRHDRSLVSVELLISQLCDLLKQRRLGQTDNSEPLGILTHHLMHDAAIWDFLPRLLGVMKTGPVRFV